ncbi:MAG: ATP phosphoribosyltransferase [Vicinamibacteria bacterium]|nr:ATP phosphoribosyltransferase [Vicinamibacteria bacterium]
MSLTIALSKGRLLTGAEALFSKGGLPFPPLDTRQLIVEVGGLRFLFVKDMDVPVYVEHGVADLGVCGSDVFQETGSDVLVPLDLGYGRCRMVLAAPTSSGFAESWPTTLRVATKYANVARVYFEARGLAAEIVKLQGSVEIAPGLGLADCIVDMVETGRTLRENGLEVVDEITTTSARLVVNRASDHIKRAEVAALLFKLRHGKDGASS